MSATKSQVTETATSAPEMKRTCGARVGAHFKKWWWAYLIIFIIVVLVVVLPVYVQPFCMAIGIFFVLGRY